jgi:carbonyl reductase 1
LIYLTARDQTRGEQALKDIRNDPQLKKAKVLRADGGLTEVKYHQLDISDTKSIKAFASFLGKEHPDGVDFGTQL